MDISILLSKNELFTLISLEQNHSEAGRRFAEAALAGAERCDLSGLAERKLAKRVGADGLELAPVVRMIADALAHADEAEERGGASGSENGSGVVGSGADASGVGGGDGSGFGGSGADGVWLVRSPCITLRCEAYPYQDGYMRVVPLKPSAFEDTVDK